MGLPYSVICKLKDEYLRDNQWINYKYSEKNYELIFNMILEPEKEVFNFIWEYSPNFSNSKFCMQRYLYGSYFA